MFILYVPANVTYGIHDIYPRWSICSLQIAARYEASSKCCNLNYYHTTCITITRQPCTSAAHLQPAPALDSTQQHITEEDRGMGTAACLGSLHLGALDNPQA